MVDPLWFVDGELDDCSPEERRAAAREVVDTGSVQEPGRGAPGPRKHRADSAESARVSSVGGPVASPASGAGETRRTPLPPLPDDLVAQLRDEARQEWAADEKATDDDGRAREAYDPPDRRGT